MGTPEQITVSNFWTMGGTAFYRASATSLLAKPGRICL